MPLHLGNGPSKRPLLEINEILAIPVILFEFPYRLITFNMAPILPPCLAGKPPA